ncbi:MAG: pyrroloquinoline quinone biosynthesis protein PqqE [Rhodobacteraceae bacterium]|nr:pyrroloquinoline quinone biosynthesis protein PqqE [Paracoccaceae bacterium]
MLAELTHRCPLSCPYCSNPLEMVRGAQEMPTEIWADVFAQAARLGVLQLHLSGGEPAARRDLPELVADARAAGLYVNLITSGIGLTAARLDALEAAGLDHVQLSLQGVRASTADRIGGYKGGFDRKMDLARLIADRGLALTINAVMHRTNLDDLPRMIEMARDLGARRIEIACVQFYGWALKNRAGLQPSRAQVDQAKAIVAAARADSNGRLVIDFVPPDYYADYPKSCMGGWGSTGLNIAPDGTVLPCHAAQTLEHLEFQNVQQTALADIWYRGAAFNAYRGNAWMPEPCQSCPRKALDHGGCRCQALALTGDAAATDPVCRKSPDRAKVDALLAEGETGTDADWVYRMSPV